MVHVEPKNHHGTGPGGYSTAEATELKKPFIKKTDGNPLSGDLFQTKLDFSSCFFGNIFWFALWVGKVFEVSCMFLWFFFEGTFPLFSIWIIRKDISRFSIAWCWHSFAFIQGKDTCSTERKAQTLWILKRQNPMIKKRWQLSCIFFAKLMILLSRCLLCFPTDADRFGGLPQHELR